PRTRVLSLHDALPICLDREAVADDLGPFRAGELEVGEAVAVELLGADARQDAHGEGAQLTAADLLEAVRGRQRQPDLEHLRLIGDRKSTRLNSSHVSI